MWLGISQAHLIEREVSPVKKKGPLAREAAFANSQACGPVPGLVHTTKIDVLAHQLVKGRSDPDDRFATVGVRLSKLVVNGPEQVDCDRLARARGSQLGFITSNQPTICDPTPVSTQLTSPSTLRLMLLPIVSTKRHITTAIAVAGSSAS